MFYRKYGKRIMDLIMATIALVVLSPVFLIVAILVRTKLGRPVIFKQKRPGLQEKIFTLYKFRTMTEMKDENNVLLPDSMRLTKLGRFLKTTSLDELPELWNILRGDMGIVGPRPLLVQYLPYYREEERLRHTVRPGLSGLAQINGRNKLGWDKRLGFDVDYVRSLSLRLDIQIILKTVLKAIKREGVTILDQASLKDLHDERSKALTFITLEYEDFIQYKKRIIEFLEDSYQSNFIISKENCDKLCNEKIVELDDYVKSGQCILIGAQEDEFLVGFLWVYKHDYFGEMRLHVNQIVVDQDYRGRGIGSRLLIEVEKKACELGVKAIDLYVSENNPEAIRMYEKSNFTTERRYLSKKLS